MNHGKYRPCACVCVCVAFAATYLLLRVQSMLLEVQVSLSRSKFLCVWSTDRLRQNHSGVWCLVTKQIPHPSCSPAELGFPAEVTNLLFSPTP